MKYRTAASSGPILSCLVIAVSILSLTGEATAQEKKAAKPKPASAAKTPAKPPGAATKYDQLLQANIKMLNVLSRYADTLSSATDATTAGLAVNRLEGITKDAIAAGDEIVKLGRPTPEMEDRLAKDPDLAVTSRGVAEQTRTAVKSLAANQEAKAILAPAIENFQAALNRLQQSAEEPAEPAKPKVAETKQVK